MKVKILPRNHPTDKYVASIDGEWKAYFGDSLFEALGELLRMNAKELGVEIEFDREHDQKIGKKQGGNQDAEDHRG